MKKAFVYISTLIFLLCYCSASQFGWKTEKEPEGETSKKNYVEDFDPLALEEEDIEVQPVEKAPAVETEQEEIAETVRSEDLALNQKEMIQGFRIQLMATTDEIQVRDAKKRAIFKFQTGVYLVFEAPHYKLRIGDCATKQEAEELKKEAIRNGFRDAWIVPSKVYNLKDDASNL